MSRRRRSQCALPPVEATGELPSNSLFEPFDPTAALLYAETPVQVSDMVYLAKVRVCGGKSRATLYVLSSTRTPHKAVT